MDRRTFNEFRKLIYEKSGINLQENKEPLVSARVGKRLRALKIDCFHSYLKYIKDDESGVELVNFLDVISTNVTHFFREPDHFDFLKEIIVDWISFNQRQFRIWSAASSSGEEPYSIAMMLSQAAGSKRFDMKVLATDISSRVLDKARLGIYDREKMESVSKNLRLRYFETIPGKNGDCYQVVEPLRKMVIFGRINLAAPPFPMKGPFDLVFCRNVMIYFDNQVRSKLIQEIYRLLKPGGYLLTGHTESLSGVKHNFQNIRPSIYIK